MKYIGILFLIILSSFFNRASAQGNLWQLGLRSGLSYYSHNMNPQPPELVSTDYETGADIALFTQFGGLSGYFVQLEVGYIGKSSKLTIPDDSNIFFTFQNHYLNFPALLGFNTRPLYLGSARMQFFFAGGFSFSYLMKGNLKIGLEGIDFEQVQEVTDELKRTEFGLLLRTGFRFLADDRGYLSTELTFNNGFSDFSGGTFGSTSFTHFGFSFGLGVGIFLNPPKDKERFYLR